MYCNIWRIHPQVMVNTTRSIQLILIVIPIDHSSSHSPSALSPILSSLGLRRLSRFLRPGGLVFVTLYHKHYNTALAVARRFITDRYTQTRFFESNLNSNIHMNLPPRLLSGRNPTREELQGTDLSIYPSIHLYLLIYLSILFCPSICLFFYSSGYLSSYRLEIF